MKRYCKKQVRWYIYFLEVDNVVKSSYYGRTKIFYTGIAIDLVRRLKQHLSGQKSRFLNRHFTNARKNLVYTEYFYGNEFQAMKREKHLKALNHERKNDLITSIKNELICYRPMKFITLRSPSHEKEFVLRF